MHARLASIARLAVFVSAALGALVAPTLAGWQIGTRVGETWAGVVLAVLLAPAGIGVLVALRNTEGPRVWRVATWGFAGLLWVCGAALLL